MPFAKRQAYFVKENWDWTCHFSVKQVAFLTFKTRLSKKDPLLEQTSGHFLEETSKFAACAAIWK